jgi:hypothetical protein
VKTAEVLTKVGIKFENLSRPELGKRFPQFRLGSVTSAVFEPESGALLARRAVQAVVADFHPRRRPLPSRARRRSNGKRHGEVRRNPHGEQGQSTLLRIRLRTLAAESVSRSCWAAGSSPRESSLMKRTIPGFDQAAFSKGSVLCIGAGGIISQIAPTLVRKGIGRITLLDDDLVEPSNLNRQRFYIKDIGVNKAIAHGIDLACDVAICGVDNNPARATASRFFRAKHIPMIFTAVSRDADHGYVFVQYKGGPCIACVFPDTVNDDRYP